MNSGTTTRGKPVRQVAERAAAPGEEPVRVGYTDVVWAWVAELFERRDERGTPPERASWSLRVGAGFLARRSPYTFATRLADYFAYAI